MQPIADKISNEEIVKAALLKEKLGGDFDGKREKDPEARRQAVREYIKTFSGTSFGLKDIEAFYDFRPGVIAAYVRKLLEQGYVTKERQTLRKGNRVTGYSNTYYWHDTPVEPSKRTMPPHRSRSNVTVSHKPELIETEKKLELIHQEAVKERSAERDEFLVQLEVAAWEYIRDADNIEAEENVRAIKAFIKYHRDR